MPYPYEVIYLSTSKQKFSTNMVELQMGGCVIDVEAQKMSKFLFR